MIARTQTFIRAQGISRKGPLRWSTGIQRLSSSSRSTLPSEIKGWRKYAQQFRDKPASYMTTFAILHEITAIIPFPIIYYTLDYSEFKVPVPETVVAEGNRVVSKLRARYGYEPLDPGNRTMINLATTYAIVKALLPARILASVAMTPFFAEKCIGPILASMSNLAKNILRR